MSVLRVHIAGILALVLCLFMGGGSKAQTITMPRNGHDTVYLTSGNTYTILDPGGTNNYYSLDNSTLVLIATDGRPFSISGEYHIMGGHCLTIYQGSSNNYPIENYYTDTSGNVDVYCPGGAATLNFTTTLGRRAGFALTVCFPAIYDVQAHSTNSTYTNLSWTDQRWDWYGWSIDYHLSNDPAQSTTHHTTYTNSDSLSTLAPGFEYTYYVGNNYYEWGTTDICTMPPHKFRTPKVQDCNTCDHYRECIDYTDFNNASQVMCYKGNTGKPDSALCVVNEGSESPLSQHTINTDTMARDSRTGGLLRTIPEGDTASVRLGNWTASGGGESILYEIHVDTNDYDLLMLRYAVVFKYSSGVGGGLPRFTIRLFDQNCMPVNPLCYCRDYVCDSSNTLWHVTGTGGSSAPYVWHDWIAMSIDISAYHGKTLYLQLSTRDGTASGAAYAYYTLHCDRKQIDHLQQCANNIANTFYAPEGFTYRWYKANQPGITLSTTRSLHVDSSGLYLCQVNNRECPEGHCGYIINALASPRYALADFDDSATAANCRFSVRLTNRSVVTDADSVPLWTREDCETAFWDFGDGRTSTNYNTEVVYTNPGTYNITLITAIANGQCADTMTKSITLNWQYPRATISGPTRVCPGTDVNLMVNHTTSQTWHVWVYQHTYPELPLDELDSTVNVTCDVTDSNQCTYTLSRTVTVLPAYNQYYSLNRCEAQLPFSWRDTSFQEGTTTGDYVFHRQTTQMCDSTVTLHLNILPTYNTWRTENVCDYAAHWRYHGTLHGQSFDTTYTHIGENLFVHHLPSGCDSIVHITLNRLTAPRTTIYARRCEGYAFDSADFHVSALQTQDTDFLLRTRRMTLTPCDSFATLRLSIFPPSDTSISLVITQNELPYILAGDTFTTNVTNHGIHLTNHHGCDSTIHFTLRINMNTSITLRDTVCADALPYTWDGLVFNAAGRQQIVYPRGNGADSVVYHLLTVRPTYDLHDTIHLCQNEMPFTWHDSILDGTTMGLSTHVKHCTTAYGCDSLMTLHLTLSPVYNTHLTDTICNNNIPFVWNDTTLTDTLAGSRSLNSLLQSTNSCDSLVTLALTVKAVTYSSIHNTVVENELPHAFNGVLFDRPVNDTAIIIPNSAGCDSIILYTLTVHWNQHTAVDSTVCANMLPLVWDGTLFDSTDFQLSTLNSTLSTKLDTLTDIQGADSVVVRTLHVNPVHNLVQHDTICNNQTSYLWTDTVISFSMSYSGLLNCVRNLATQAECDSTRTLMLYINAVTSSTIHDTIVENQLPFSFNGTIFTLSDFDTAGFDADATLNTQLIITNHAGCDSIINYSLTVHWNQRTLVDSTVCANMLPLVWDGTLFDSTDFNFSTLNSQLSTKHDTLTSNQGADSIVVRTLRVNPVYNLHQHDTLCNDQTSYLWVDTTISFSFSGSGTLNCTRNLSSTVGCDSVRTLTLTINAVTSSSIHDTIVENQLPWTFNGFAFGKTNYDTQNGALLNRQTLDTALHIANAMGCDSAISYHLTVHPNVYDTIDSTICLNFLPLQWNARTFDTSDFNFSTLNSRLSTKNDTLTAFTGADSLLTMRLTVNPTYSISHYDTICSNDETVFIDSTYNVAGTYPHLFSSINNCDSIEVLHLTVFGTSVADMADTIVENQLPYSFNEFTFAPTNYETHNGALIIRQTLDTVLHIVNALGCDSAISYHLTVHPNVYDTIDSTICQNFLPLHWNARTFDTSDFNLSTLNPQLSTKNDTLTAWTGADSLLTMHLTVNPNTSSTLHDTITENELPWPFNTLTLNYSNFDTAGFDANTLLRRQPSTLNTQLLIANQAGCDSLIDYHLTVVWNKVTHLDSTICQNSLPLLWEGISFDTSDFNFSTSNSQPSTKQDTAIYSGTMGEDSLVVLHLTVNTNSSSLLSDTIVENQLPWTWNGITFDTSALHLTALNSQLSTLTDSTILVNAKGCDSLTTMNVIVWLNREAEADSSVCENFLPFEWNNKAFPRDSFQVSNINTQQSLLLTTHGADSLLTMNVTMLVNTSATVVDTIFERQLPYLFNGYLFADTMFTDTAAWPQADGIYRLSWLDSTVTISNAAGCDSLISYRLYVHWNIHHATDSTICADLLPMQWNAPIFDTSDYTHFDSLPFQILSKYDTLPAWNGADSILEMRLRVNTTYVTNIHDTVCEAQSYIWYGDTLTITDIYAQHFTTIQGCDSSEYLHFANYPNYNFTYYDTICDYSGVMRMGVEYIGTAHLNTIHLCDSNETYHLWGMPVSYSTIDTIIGDNHLPFTFGEETFADTSGAAMQLILTNQWGCDSIVSFTLTVLPTWRLTLDSTVCADMLPLVWDGTVFDSSDFQLPTLNSQLSTKHDTLTAAHGVDSIVTRRLHINPVFDLDYVDTTCNGAPYAFGDSLYSLSGIYTHYYLTHQGCDSVETLTLQVNAMSFASQSDTIVQNQLPYTFGGVTFSSLAGVSDTIITILNTVACDSVITYSLTVLPNTYRQKDTTLCDNQLPMVWDGISFQVSNLNSQLSSLSDSTVVLLPDGTDSITRYNVTVHPSYNLTDTLQSCDSLTWINGIHYTESTDVDNYSLTSSLGCDSIKNLRLTIYHSAATTDSITSCDPLVWIDSFTYSQSISGVAFMLATVHGCDSLVSLAFTKVEHKQTSLFDTICQGSRYAFGGNEYELTGVYDDSLLTVMGCDSVVTLNLEVLKPYHVSIDTSFDCDKRTYTLTARTDAPYIWWNSFPIDPAVEEQETHRTITVLPRTHELYLLYVDYKDVPTCPSSDSVYLSPLLKPHALIAYTPEFLTLDQPQLQLHSRSTNEQTLHWWINDDDFGDFRHLSYIADATQMPAEVDSVRVMLVARNGVCTDTALVLIPFRKAAIWVPNTFTPGESNNNLFFVRYIGITDYSIDLYTRGGALVWHSEDMTDTWDGTHQGRPCPQGTYVWIIHYRDITNPRNLLSKKGTVTLLR